MTKNEIILMADASGLSFYGMGKDRDKFLHYLEVFADLVAAAKPWQGLTDEEIETTWSQLWRDINQMKLTSDDRPQKETIIFLFARAIEAALRSKNA